MDLFIRSITGQEEMLTDHEVTRKDAVNGDKYINVSIVRTENNEHSFPLIINENIFIYDDEEYVIKQHKESLLGFSTKIECTAIHRMFDDLKNNYIYETESGTKRLDFLMNFALSNSNYTYSLITDELPLSVQVENFGDDNSLALFKSVLDKFGAEFEISGTHITVKKHVGSQTDSQFRYKYNISNPSKDINTDSFSTYIRGYGKQNEDGTYMAQVEYTSPLAELFDIKHADPVRDERFSNNQELLDFCIRSLNDRIEMSIQLTYIQLKEMGIEEINKGDYVWCILDPFGIDVRIRVLEIEDYSNQLKSPVFTLGTITKKATDIIASFNTTKNKVDKLLTEDGSVKYTFLDSTVKQATEALQSAQSELEFVNGIIARDKENPNNLVIFNSAGVGVSTDAGETFKTAMTAEAIVSFRVIGSDIQGGTITGAELISINSDSQDITEIVGGKISSSGRFTRDFDVGQTAEYISTFDSYNGALRIGITSKKGQDGIERILTDGRALIYTDKAISSQRAIHSASVDKKGARFLDFFADETLTSDVQGLGFHMYSGQHILLESHTGMTIRSDTSFVNLQPEFDNEGNNTFSFQIVDSDDVTHTDGLLYYGSDVNGFASGIRFSKAASDPTIYIVDGSGEMGTGRLDLKELYARETLIVAGKNIMTELAILADKVQALENR
jgi:phage minor structural protein